MSEDTRFDASYLAPTELFGEASAPGVRRKLLVIRYPASRRGYLALILLKNEKKRKGKSWRELL